MTAEYDRLDSALANGDEEPFRRLSEGDAVVREASDGGYTLLHVAVRRGCVEAAGCLLRAGADPDATNAHLERSPLHYAAMEADSAMVALLLEHRATVDLRDAGGMTALLWAPAGHDAGAVIARLLDAGADIEAAVEGDTALHFAAAEGAVVAARILLERGADPDPRDKTGASPLHFAAGNDDEAASGTLHNPSIEIARLLIDCGADINALDTDHNTPLDLAHRRRKRGAAVAAFLEQQGGKRGRRIKKVRVAQDQVFVRAPSTPPLIADLAHVAEAPDGQVIITRAWVGSVLVVSTRGGGGLLCWRDPLRPPERFLRETTAIVQGIYPSPDGELIAMTIRGREADRWFEPPGGLYLASLATPEEPRLCVAEREELSVMSVRWAPDGQQLAVGVANWRNPLKPKHRTTKVFNPSGALLAETEAQLEAIPHFWSTEELQLIHTEANIPARTFEHTFYRWRLPKEEPPCETESSFIISPDGNYRLEPTDIGLAIIDAAGGNRRTFSAKQKRIRQELVSIGPLCGCSWIAPAWLLFDDEKRALRLEDLHIANVSPPEAACSSIVTNHLGTRACFVIQRGLATGSISSAD